MDSSRPHVHPHLRAFSDKRPRALLCKLKSPFQPLLWPAVTAQPCLQAEYTCSLTVLLVIGRGVAWRMLELRGQRNILPTCASRCRCDCMCSHVPATKTPAGIVYSCCMLLLVLTQGTACAVHKPLRASATILDASCSAARSFWMPSELGATWKEGTAHPESE